MVLHRNTQAPYLHALLTVGGLALGLVLSIPTGVVESLGLPFSIAVSVLIVILPLNVGTSLIVFARVDIEQGRVLLWSIFGRKVIVTAKETTGVELVPPVSRITLEWSWRERQSLLTIHRRGKAPIKTSAMPEGLKLLIAHALDPAGFPLPASGPS